MRPSTPSEGSSERGSAVRSWLPLLGVLVLLVVVVTMVRAADGQDPTPIASPEPSQSSEPSATEAPAAEREVVLFIGDSYAAGVGASRGTSRWTSVVARSEGWLEMNLGRSGTGYLASPPAEVCGFSRCPNYLAMATRAVEEAPDVVVVGGGQNDDFLAYQDFASVRRAINDTFFTLRAGLPEVRIVAVGPKPIWGVTDTLVALEDAVQAAAEANGGLFVSLTRPGIFDPSFFLEDGFHVNDMGHQALADRVIRSLDCWEELPAIECSSVEEESSLQVPDA